MPMNTTMPASYSPPLSGLQAAWDPQSDPLGLGLQQQVQDNYWGQVAAGNPGPFNAGPTTNPQWSAWLQAVHNAAGGRPVAFGAGASPEGSNQLTGFQTPDAFAGTESYSGHTPHFQGYSTASGYSPGTNGAGAASSAAGSNQARGDQGNPAVGGGSNIATARGVVAGLRDAFAPRTYPGAGGSFMPPQNQ